MSEGKEREDFDVAVSEQSQWEKDREERRYRDRREKFALAAFRFILIREQGSKLCDWKELAKEAVQAADFLEEELNPSPPDLPEYQP